MIYRHRNITKDQFRQYQKRYSPYGTVASIYLWAVSAGAIPGLTDPAETVKKGSWKKCANHSRIMPENINAGRRALWLLI